MSTRSLLNVSSIPQDFPRASLVHEVLSDYRLCEEHVIHVIHEVKKEQLRSPFISTPEIVDKYLMLAKRNGWGCFPGEIEWIFRSVVRELGCDLPRSLEEEGSWHFDKHAR